MQQGRRAQGLSIRRRGNAERATPKRVLVTLAAIVALLALPAAGASAASVVATIPLAAGTFEASANPSTSRLYVTNYSAGSMSVVDTATNAVLSTLPLTTSPVMLDVNSVTNTIYVTHQGAGNALTVLDGATNSVITVIPISNPFSPRVNEITNRVYIALTFGGGVTVLNGATNAITTTVPTSGDSTIGIAVDQSRNLVYASDRHANVVDVIDGATNTLLDTIPLGFVPGQLEVDESLNKLYVIDSGGSVAVIDGATRSVTGSIPVGQQPTGIALNQATHRVYVSNLASNTVSVIDNATDAVIDTVVVGNSPAWLGLDRSTGRVYVPNTGSGGGVSVIEDAVPANPCDITQDHSIEGVTPVDLTIYNDTDATVTVYWLDYTGQQREWYTLGPNDSFTQETFLTHPWLMIDADSGECVGYALADAEEYHITHTVPPPVDSDGDGLLDTWETDGIDADGDGTIDLALDLPPFNADPLHKDQYLEVDYMDAPQAGTLADVTAAFAAAPVGNPDSTSGVRLHAMLGEVVPTYASVCFWDCANFPAPVSFQGLKSGGPADCDGHLGTPAERASANCPAILAARRLAFRYAIFGQTYSERPGSSGVGEIGGNDLMVTVAGKTPEWIVAAGGLESAEAGTLMHELGHTLGLDHGGGDAINCKPNYQSVMSYSLQVPNIDPSRPLDYSREELPPLDEGDLDETAGILASSGNGVFGLNGVPTVFDAAGPVDWNGDDVIDTGISADINYILRANGTQLCPPPPEPTTPDELLLGHDDWSTVIFNFRLTPGFANGVADPPSPTPTKELTSTEALDTAKAVDSDGDGIPNSSESVCTVTRAYVQGSAKYQSATPKQRNSADVQVGNACGAVEKITRTTKPPQKKGYVASFKDKIDGLRTGGWLTLAQANTLKAMVDTL